MFIFQGTVAFLETTPTIGQLILGRSGDGDGFHVVRLLHAVVFRPVLPIIRKRGAFFRGTAAAFTAIETCSEFFGKQFHLLRMRPQEVHHALHRPVAVSRRGIVETGSDGIQSIEPEVLVV